MKSSLARFIPTCVGNTGVDLLFFFVHPVHPHVCGEHYSLFVICYSGIGSSPRVWGTPSLRHSSLSYSRFIPTCVGNTHPRLTGSAYTPVHPHVCGEHYVSTDILCPGAGSSPRVWGTLCLNGYPVPGRRFIPTCVGNT